MCINAFFAARFETDLRRQWIAAGLLLFSHKKYRSLYLVSSLSLFLGDGSGECHWRGCPFPTTHCPLFSSRKCLVTRLDINYVMSFSWKNRSCSVVSARTSPFHFHYFNFLQFTYSLGVSNCITKWCFHLTVGVVLLRLT